MISCQSLSEDFGVGFFFSLFFPYPMKFPNISSQFFLPITLETEVLFHNFLFERSLSTPKNQY